MKLYTVYDSKVEAYLTPFFLPNADMAIRVFTDCANDSAHQFCRWASDYTLFQIGEYDDTSGRLLAIAEHINLGLAASYKSRDLAVTPVPVINYEEVN